MEKKFQHSYNQLETHFKHKIVIFPYKLFLTHFLGGILRVSHAPFTFGVLGSQISTFSTCHFCFSFFPIIHNHYIMVASTGKPRLGLDCAGCCTNMRRVSDTTRSLSATFEVPALTYSPLPGFCQ